MILYVAVPLLGMFHTIAPSVYIQLVFYYHMYGHRVSSLSVSLVSVCGVGFNTTVEVLKNSGSANRWRQASVSLTKDIPRTFGP